jgi:ribonucleoside-diphosphate reductase alpha chain
MNDSMSSFAKGIFESKYSHTKADGTKESWKEVAKRLRTVMKTVNASKSLIDQAEQFIAERKFIPGGRYLYATGRPFHQVQNCLLLRAEDSREGWSQIMHQSAMALMTGAGIGIDYSRLRERGAIIRKTGGEASGPTALMQMVNETGRHVMQGGSRRSAIWAGLNWAHPDIMEFLTMKDWTDDIKGMKGKDFNFPAPMDMTNISVQLDDEFFQAYHNKKDPKHSLAHNVYWAVVRHMLETGEPGFSIDIGKNRGETLRNACTEVTSADDSDICNLASINMARITSIEEMMAVTEVATAFLLAGTVYSDVPYEKVDTIRQKNRRLGLGLMGLHDWLMLRGHRYGPNAELDKYLEVYSRSTEHAHAYADDWSLSRPVKTRAIAPTGTIGIVGETTTGIEPMFAAAYKRRYLKGKTWHYEYVIDPTAKRAVEKYGVRPLRP